MYFRSLVLPIFCLLLASCVTEQKSLITAPEADVEVRSSNHVELAAGYLKLNRYETATKEIEKALKIDPSNSRAHHVAASLAMKLGELESAEKSFLTALKLDPKSGSTAHELGVLLCKRGRREDGVSYLNQAINNQFFEHKAISALRAGECLGKTQPNIARGYLDKALALNKNLDVALYRKAEVLYLEGYPMQARGFYERYMQNKKQNSQTLLLGYRIETNAKSLNQAEIYANRLLNEFPASIEAKKLKQIVAEKG